MEDDPENGKELTHSAHANGMNERINYKYLYYTSLSKTHTKWIDSVLEKNTAFRV
jgi:hypothetical protein